MNQLRMQQAGTGESELDLPNSPVSGPLTDDISYFTAVVRKEIKPSGLPSLEINLIVTEILDAARESALTGKRVELIENRPR
jgi:predicted dehydrogenase